MKSLKLLILSSIILAGCQSVQPLPVIEYSSKLSIDSSLLQPCGTLIDNMPYGASFEDVLTVKATDALTFAECRKSKEHLIKLIQDYLLK